MHNWRGQVVGEAFGYDPHYEHTEVHELDLLSPEETWERCNGDQSIDEFLGNEGTVESLVEFTIAEHYALHPAPQVLRDLFTTKLQKHLDAWRENDQVAAS